MSDAPSCDRCGNFPAMNRTIIYDPLTEEGEPYNLCDDCQFRLCRIMDLFIRRGDE